MNNYSETDLKCLHEELLTILKEILRICGILNVRCFVTGGTAIGAFYFNGFVKWDDDIDLGMWREDYELFIKKAPSLVSDGFFVQTLKTEPNTPFYFTKIRKDETLFIQHEHKDIQMHQGIFVDIFPFDKVPDNHLVARIHTRLVQYYHGSFLRRQRKEAILEGQAGLPPFISNILASFRYSVLRLVPKRFFIWRLKTISSLFNNCNCSHADVIVSSVDRISSDSIRNLQRICFEGIELFAPGDLEGYLKNHYPKLKSPDMLESLWSNHAPEKLSFSVNRK